VCSFFFGLGVVWFFFFCAFPCFFFPSFCGVSFFFCCVVLPFCVFFFFLFVFQSCLPPACFPLYRPVRYSLRNSFSFDPVLGVFYNPASRPLPWRFLSCYWDIYETPIPFSPLFPFFLYRGFLPGATICAISSAFLGWEITPFATVRFLGGILPFPISREEFLLMRLLAMEWSLLPPLFLSFRWVDHSSLFCLQSGACRETMVFFTFARWRKVLSFWFHCTLISLILVPLIPARLSFPLVSFSVFYFSFPLLVCCTLFLCYSLVQLFPILEPLLFSTDFLLRSRSLAFRPDHFPFFCAFCFCQDVLTSPPVALARLSCRYDYCHAFFPGLWCDVFGLLICRFFSLIIAGGIMLDPLSLFLVEMFSSRNFSFFLSLFGLALDRFSCQLWIMAPFFLHLYMPSGLALATSRVCYGDAGSLFRWLPMVPLPFLVSEAGFY